MWFQAKETGVFEIACAQHCGAWHYKMRGELAVLTEEAFSRWSARAAADAALRVANGVGGASGSLPLAPPGPGAAAVTHTSTSADGWDWVPPRD
jgi:heme/copper-type cytochrome/quinol oxidase subunit 2